MHQNDMQFATTTSPIRIGIVSDTHGCLPEGLPETLGPVDVILHAGDIGEPVVIEALEKIAPVFAVRGNMDQGQWAETLPMDRLMQFGPATVYMRHILSDLDMDPIAAGIRVVIHGHTHRPDMVRRNGIDIVNPGSAAFPRHGHGPTIARMDCRNGDIRIRIIPVDIG